MRHRASGLHSFRTIVASEWVHRGRVQYLVTMEKLREPFAFGIGVVRPDSNVNSALGWTPGVVCAPPRTGWGVCWEGRPEGSPGNERRSSPHSSWRSDRYREGDPKLPVGVREGDGVFLIIDMTAGGPARSRYGAVVYYQYQVRTYGTGTVPYRSLLYPR